jgi:hypothetical protein
MPDTKTHAAPPDEAVVVNNATNVSAPATENVAPLAGTVSPLAAAKMEVDAAIDGLMIGYSRVRVARLRDAIDQLRAAIPVTAVLDEAAPQMSSVVLQRL